MGQGWRGSRGRDSAFLGTLLASIIGKGWRGLCTRRTNAIYDFSNQEYLRYTCARILGSGVEAIPLGRICLTQRVSFSLLTIGDLLDIVVANCAAGRSVWLGSRILHYMAVQLHLVIQVQPSTRAALRKRVRAIRQELAVLAALSRCVRWEFAGLAEGRQPHLRKTFWKTVSQRAVAFRLLECMDRRGAAWCPRRPQ